jgi:hypothetical protein
MEELKRGKTIMEQLLEQVVDEAPPDSGHELNRRIPALHFATVEAVESYFAMKQAAASFLACFAQSGSSLRQVAPDRQAVRHYRQLRDAVRTAHP